LECHIDSGRRDDALHVAQAAMSFTKANIPHKCKEIFLLQVCLVNYFSQSVCI